MICVAGRAQTVHRSDTALVRRVDGERLLVEVRSGACYRLDGAGARLWDLIEIGTTPERAVDQLVEDFVVTRARLEADVTSLLTTLERAGLIRAAVTRGDSRAATGPPPGLPLVDANTVLASVTREGWDQSVRTPTMSAYRKRLSSDELSATVRWLTVHALHEALEPPIAEPLDDDAFGELVGFVRNERIEPLLLNGLNAGLPGTDAQRQQARALARQAAHWDLSLEQALVRAGELFDAHGIDWYVLKGLATARLLYPTPELRSTSDVDVLVHPSQYMDALELLRGSELVERERPAHGPASERHERSVTFIARSGVRIDVHRWIQGAFRSHEIAAADLFESWQALSPSPGRSFRALTTPLVILHAMLHLGTGRPGRSSLAPLTPLTDLVWSRHLHTDDYREAFALARANGCLTPAAWADRVVSQWLAACGTPAGQAIGPTPPGPVLVAYDRALGTRGVRSTLQRLTGPEKLRRSWETAFPSKEFRQRYGYSVVGQLGHVLRLSGQSRVAAGRSRPEA